LRDVSDWIFLGHGEMSTLPKEDLRSPEGILYVMKYPRPFDGKRVNWEDVNEVIAAKIASLLQLPSVHAEIAYRHGQRGCLMVHFVKQLSADFGEVGASLLTAQFEEVYLDLQNSGSPSDKLVKESFQMIGEFSYFSSIKYNFIAMNLYDILIGNQDRHSYNWQILFKGEEILFAPLYDNGASLGWQLPDSYLQTMLNDEQKMSAYLRRMKIKAGLLEDKFPPLKSTDVLNSLLTLFPIETKEFANRMMEFDWKSYFVFIDGFPLITEIRKKFLKKFIQFRMNKLIQYIVEGRVE